MRDVFVLGIGDSRGTRVVFVSLSPNGAGVLALY